MNYSHIGGGDHGPRPRDAARLLRRDATALAGRAQADRQNPPVVNAALRNTNSASTRLAGNVNRMNVPILRQKAINAKSKSKVCESSPG